MTNPNDHIQTLYWKKREDGVPELVTENSGLTKREYFAAMALSGLSSALRVGNNTPKSHAEAAVNYADALIKALNENN